MPNLKQLIKKKNLTGEELGIIEVANAAVMFKQNSEGKRIEPIMDMSELQRLINGIKDPAQKRTYNGYVSIHEWISLYYNIGLSNEQQAQLRYKDLLSYITEASISEDIYEHVSRLPVIMTESQFERTRWEAIEKWLRDDSGKERKNSVTDMICMSMDYYVSMLSEHPRKKNPLRAIRKKYLNEPVNSQIILSRYNKAANRGYYTLPDGRRSDEMTPTQWAEARITPKMKKMLNSPFEDATEEIEAIDELEKKLRIQQARRLWESGEDKITTEDLDLYIEYGFVYREKWNIYDTPPEGLTKWDIIEDCLVLPQIYRNALTGNMEDEKAYKEEINDFAAEFAELIDALLNDIDERGIFDRKVSGCPAESWHLHKVGMFEVFDKNHYDIRDAVYNNKEIICDGNKRAMLNGIAVLNCFDNDLMDTNADEEGNYIPPRITHSVESPHRLDGLFPESKEREGMADAILKSRTALIESYYFMKGFNLVLDMIGEYFQIPELDAFKMDLEGIECKIDHLNGLTLLLYKRIFNTDYEEKQLKEKKLQVLKDNFATIDYRDIEIPEKNAKLLRGIFKNFKAFKNPFLIEDLVLYRTLRPGSPYEGVL